ncbi:Uncharacterised protein [Bordetella pertussis]|nr:Uncharacterised protein [Bordetella pertussis]
MKFSTSTSASASRPRSSSWPAGCDRSSAMPRLLRLTPMK